MLYSFATSPIEFIICFLKPADQSIRPNSPFTKCKQLQLLSGCHVARLVSSPHLCTMLSDSADKATDYVSLITPAPRLPSPNSFRFPLTAPPSPVYQQHSPVFVSNFSNQSHAIHLIFRHFLSLNWFFGYNIIGMDCPLSCVMTWSLTGDYMKLYSI